MNPTPCAHIVTAWALGLKTVHIVYLQPCRTAMHACKYTLHMWTGQSPGVHVSNRL